MERVISACHFPRRPNLPQETVSRLDPALPIPGAALSERPSSSDLPTDHAFLCQGCCTRHACLRGRQSYYSNIWLCYMCVHKQIFRRVQRRSQHACDFLSFIRVGSVRLRTLLEGTWPPKRRLPNVSWRWLVFGNGCLCVWQRVLLYMTTSAFAYGKMGRLLCTPFSSALEALFQTLISC